MLHLEIIIIIIIVIIIIIIIIIMMIIIILMNRIHKGRTITEMFNGVLCNWQSN